MSTQVNVAGTYKSLANADKNFINVGGVNKVCKNVWINVSGMWRSCYPVDPIMAYSDWTLRSPGVTSKSCIAYGAGAYVILRAAGTNSYTYSSDGINWYARTTPASTSWGYIVWTGSIFYAHVGYLGTVAMTSTNGLTWTARTKIAAGGTISACGSTIIMASGNLTEDLLWTSTDGVSWTSRAITRGNPGIWGKAAYGNGIYVIIKINTSSNTIATSTNLSSWTVRNVLPTSGTWLTITFGNGRFVALRSNSNIGATSTDGINWTSIYLTSNVYWSDVTFGGDTFVAVASSGSNYSNVSTDGINWFYKSLPSGTWGSVAYGNNQFVALDIASASGNIASLDRSVVSTDIASLFPSLPSMTWLGAEADEMGMKFTVTANFTINCITLFNADGMPDGSHDSTLTQPNLLADVSLYRYISDTNLVSLVSHVPNFSAFTPVTLTPGNTYIVSGRGDQTSIWIGFMAYYAALPRSLYVAANTTMTFSGWCEINNSQITNNSTSATIHFKFN